MKLANYSALGSRSFETVPLSYDPLYTKYMTETGITGPWTRGKQQKTEQTSDIIEEENHIPNTTTASIRTPPSCHQPRQFA